jgi:hypothetical protein
MLFIFLGRGVVLQKSPVVSVRKAEQVPKTSAKRTKTAPRVQQRVSLLYGNNKIATPSNIILHFYSSKNYAEEMRIPC